MLRYIAPTEDCVESIFPAGHGPAVLLLASSGIPALYRLATVEGARITALDFEPDQVLLLHLLARAALELPLEEFRALVAGQSTLKGDELISAAAQAALFAAPEALASVLETYRSRVAKDKDAHVSKWYSWLAKETYTRLRRALHAESLDVLLGELTAVLLFEPDNTYDFIDLSNCREWNYYRTHIGPFSGAELYGGFEDQFCAWDRKLVDLCVRKMKNDAILRTTSYPEEPGGVTPPLEQCHYWSTCFSLVGSNERVVPYNLDGRHGLMATSFYRKRS